MKKVLILNGQYFPGYKGGGPIQSCINLVENLADDFEFYVICADRDYKEKEPYKNVKINAWNKVGSAQVYYMSSEEQNLKGFEKMLNSISYDVLYLNGFFSPIFTIKPLVLKRLKRLKNDNIILTPRGDFTGGCENKKIKKYSYIFISKIIGLYKNLRWQATSKIEKNDILKKFPKAKIYTIPNLSSKFFPKKISIKKESGELRLIFLSRIFPKKNLKFALEILEKIKLGKIIFDIYGPMEDSLYWKECEDIINRMPEHVKVTYCGEIEHSKIPVIFSKYHAFFFPTLGENYGHVIVEAMMNNCLCLLSKYVTPWDKYIHDLDLGGELDNPDTFIESIQTLLDYNQEDFLKVINKNNEFVEENFSNEENLKKYRQLFNTNGR